MIQAKSLELQEELNHYSNECITLSNKVRTLQDDLSAKDKEIAELKSRIGAKDARIAELLILARQTVPR